MPGVKVEAEAWRHGKKLVSISASLGSRLGEKRTIFPSDTNVFLNVQTNHPMPPREDVKGATDPLCLGNRPRLLQFTFDEVPTSEVWQLINASVSIDQSKTDAITVPFESTKRATKRLEGDGEKELPLEVIAAKFGISNLYTGEEVTPTMGDTVGPGYLEDQTVYWLRYQ